MGCYPLVDEQVEDGRRWAEALAEAGVAVALAFWGRIDDDDQHYLYIASPDLDTRGPRVLFAEVRRAFGRLLDRGEVRLTTPDSVKLLSPSHRLVAGLLAWNRERGVTYDARYRHTHFGGVSVDDMYVYALPTPAPAA